MRLLLGLAGQPGAILSIDALLDRVWPGLAVTSASLYQPVSRLRAAPKADAVTPVSSEKIDAAALVGS